MGHRPAGRAASVEAALSGRPSWKASGGKAQAVNGENPEILFSEDLGRMEFQDKPHLSFEAGKKDLLRLRAHRTR